MYIHIPPPGKALAEEEGRLLGPEDEDRQIAMS